MNKQFLTAGACVVIMAVMVPCLKVWYSADTQIERLPALKQEVIGLSWITFCGRIARILRDHAIAQRTHETGSWVVFGQ
jgi:hypothetical protein